MFTRDQPQRTEQVTLLSGGNGITSSFSGNLRQSDVFLSAIHAIANHASKMTISHIVQSNGTQTPGDQQLNQMLGLQPNPVSTAAEFIYKCASLYWSDPNLFIFLERLPSGSVIALWPLKPTSAQFVKDQSDSLYIKFMFASGQTVILPYSDIVHIRRIFHSSDLLGDSNTAILPAVELSTVQTAGLRKNIDTAGTIKGIISYSGALRPEDLEKQRQIFIDTYLKPGGSTVAALDSKFTYTPITSTPITINITEMDAISKKILSFLGINQAIVDGTFTEDIYSSFVEASLEPFANTLGQAMTAKMFTPRERQWGNSISIDTAGRMAFASQKTKITAIKELMPLSLLTLDQALSVLGFPPVGGADGGRRIQSLNYVDQANATAYQLAGVDKKLLKGGEKQVEGDPISNN